MWWWISGHLMKKWCSECSLLCIDSGAWNQPMGPTQTRDVTMWCKDTNLKETEATGSLQPTRCTCFSAEQHLHNKKMDRELCQVYGTSGTKSWPSKYASDNTLRSGEYANLVSAQAVLNSTLRDAYKWMKHMVVRHNHSGGISSGTIMAVAYLQAWSWQWHICRHGHGGGVCCLGKILVFRIRLGEKW